MYYIRTADRLQRTAAWIEAMDGGLDHLRAVIVDDSLGLCADLDAAMARHVSSYSDEWRDVLDDPERLRRFTSFVNAPGRTRPVDHLRPGTRPAGARATSPPTGSGRDVTVGDRSPWPTGGTAMTQTTHADLDRRSARSTGWSPTGASPPWSTGCRSRSSATDDGLFAIDNRDPVSGAYVLSRGIVGSRGGVPTVASPLHKQVYDLRSGHCLDLPGVAVARHEARCRDGLVEVRLRQEG